jgi:hypothetical protein
LCRLENTALRINQRYAPHGMRSIQRDAIHCILNRPR